MIALPSHRHLVLLPRLREIAFNTYFAEAVLRGHVTGRVWVDRPDDPEAFLVAHPCGLSLLCGETEDLEFLAWLVNYFTTPESRRRPEFVQAHPATWTRRIPHLLEGRFMRHEELPAPGSGPSDAPTAARTRVVQYTRRNFRFDPGLFASRQEPPLPVGFRVGAVGARCFGRWGQAVSPADFWDNAEEFARRGVAFAVLHAGDPVSVAFSAVALDTVLEIGIETLPEFRGRGFATQASRAFIAHCLARRCEPVWACRKGNVGSEQTALRLGFVPTRELPYYALVAPEPSPVPAGAIPGTTAMAPGR